jgi:heptose-I-phosphate ethanolaminephosphotransferase
MLERPYSNAHFIHTWSDLAGLSYDRFRPESSLVNPAFKPRVRWIGNPDVKNGLRDFDALIREQETSRNVCSFGNVRPCKRFGLETKASVRVLNDTTTTGL